MVGIPWCVYRPVHMPPCTTLVGSLPAVHIRYVHPSSKTGCQGVTVNNSYSRPGEGKRPLRKGKRLSSS